MAGRFVRASKYRHVFGQTTKREQCYDNLRVSRNAWDTNLIKANPKYLAVNWEAGGGGAFAVIPLDERGKLPDQLPLFRGHTAVVLDTDWSPFDDSLIASASDDGKVFLWQVPEDFALRTEAEEIEDVAPIGKLSGHSRKVGHVLFNPAAENILASSSGDYTIKIWDLEDGKPKLTLKGNDIFTSLSWSANGSTLVTTSRDKKLRFWDVRQERPAYEGPGHGGAKNSRVAWLGEHDRVVTTGFSKMSERQLGLWDFRAPQEPLGGFTPLDSGSGVVMPFWDDGCQMLYLAGKGDGNIRYYEYANDKFEYLSEYRSAQAQRGVAFLPKRGVNTHENEVVRAFKTVDDLYIEPISFVVPRRAETFQEDIYPPTMSTKPAMTSAEWFQGKSAVPMKLSMADVYDGNAKPALIAAADVSPPSQQSEPAPSPAKSTARPSAPAEEPRSAAPPRETPSVNSNKQSMSAAADRFADKSNGADEVSKADNDDDEPEEWKQPSSATRSRQQPQQPQPQTRQPEPAAPREAPSSTSTVTPLNLAPTTVTTTANSSTTSSSKPDAEPSSDDKPSSSSPSSSSTPSASAAAGGLRDVLHEIRSLLQGQGRQIEELTREVAALKAKVGES